MDADKAAAVAELQAAAVATLDGLTRIKVAMRRCESLGIKDTDLPVDAVAALTGVLDRLDLLDAED